MQPIRQGDVILLPLLSQSEIPGQKLPHLTLAEGEKTGHAHRISTGTAELRSFNQTLYLSVQSNVATLTHEEHRSIDIPQGNWMIRIQRQYEPDGWRAIED